MGSRASDYVYNCSGTLMFGGYTIAGNGVHVKRDFKSLPNHDTIKITGKYHILDNWDIAQHDKFHVYVDGEPVFISAFDHSMDYSFESICGLSGLGNGDEINLSFTIEIPHSKSTFNLLFVAGLNEGAGAESWGISDLNI